MLYRDFLIFYPRCIEDKLVLCQKKMDLAKCDIANLGDYSRPSHPLVFVCFSLCGLLSLGTLRVRLVHASLFPVLLGGSSAWTCKGLFIHSSARAQWSHF